MSSRIFVVLLLIALVGCAAGPERAQPAPGLAVADPVRLIDLEYAEVFGEFALVETIEYPEVELGVNLRYLGDLTADRYVDVYIYPVYLPEMLSLGNVLEFEQHQLELGIRQAWEVSEDGSGVVMQAYRPQKLEDAVLGLISSRSVSRNGAAFDTFAFLTIRDDAFLKIRKTVEADQGFTLEDFKSIVDGVTSAIDFGDEGRTRRDLSVVITANTLEDAAEGQPCLLAAWMLYGVEMKGLIEDRQYLSTLEREVKARETLLRFWVDANEEEGVDACPSAYMTRLHRIAEAGFLREHIYQAYGRPFWPLTEDLSIRDYLVWARDEVGGELPPQDSGVLIQWKD